MEGKSMDREEGRQERRRREGGWMVSIPHIVSFLLFFLTCFVFSILPYKPPAFRSFFQCKQHFPFPSLDPLFLIVSSVLLSIFPAFNSSPPYNHLTSVPV